MAITLFGSAATPTDNGTNTADPTIVTPPVSMLAGDLVVLVGERRASLGTLTISQAGGQTWTTLTQNNNNTQRIRIFWCVFNGTWSASPSVTMGATACNSAHMLVYRSSYRVGFVADNAIASAAFAAPGSPYTVTITGVTRSSTIQSVAIALWGVALANTWGTLSGAGWSQTSLAAQYRNTSGSDQSVAFAYSIGKGATGNVSLNESAGTAGASSILSFKEIPTLAVQDAYCTSQSDGTPAVILVQVHNIKIPTDPYCTSQSDKAGIAKQSTLVVNDAYCTSQADISGVTKQSALIVVDTYTTSWLDIYKLAQIHNLSPPDCYVTAQVDIPIITKQSTLTVNDAYCVSQTDIPNITKQSTLIVADSECLSQTDTVVTTKQYNLVVNDAVCVSWVDGEVIALIYNLSVQDAYCAPQLDTPTVYNPNLVVQDSYSTSQVDIVAITKQSTLVVGDTYCSSQVDSFATTKSGTLAITDAYCIPTLEELVLTLLPPQLLYPVSDVTDGNWTNELGSNTNLYDSLDEESPNDSNYIQSECSPVNSPVVVKLGNAIDPNDSSGHILRYRIERYLEDSYERDITTQLRQGYVNESDMGTLIAQWIDSDIGDTITTIEKSLTSGEADSITDYESLFVRIIAN